jgi:excinuclease ABC subunit B
MPIVQFNSPFELTSDYSPKGDQEQAIAGLVDGLDSGFRFQALLGATGTGKTYTMASVIARSQRPGLKAEFAIAESRVEGQGLGVGLGRRFC